MDRSPNAPLAPSEDLYHQTTASLEHLTQKDEGGRGIRQLLGPETDDGLRRSAFLLSQPHVRRVGILTGFPCNRDSHPPTETDGPPGALAVAKCLLRGHKEAVVLLTDGINEAPLLAAVAAHPYLHKALANKRLTVESFHPAEFCENGSCIASVPLHKLADRRQLPGVRRLRALWEELDHLVAVERSGRAADGRYYTMRGLDMTSDVAPLDILFHWSLTGPQDGIRPLTTAIGDGGNELGLGKVAHRTAQHIPKGAQIACAVSCHSLIVASVSNWGAYALAALTSALMVFAGDGSFSFDELFTTDADERQVAAALCEAGVRDGATKELAMTVDGFPMHETFKRVDRMREIVSCLIVEGRRDSMMGG
ncbi:unnamed protein product [Vitrella brassicaformis CCMP3155]|uniref:D-glutamate cyclase-like C-terminal domain-containing protein n=1 Tax=Vitrella brassicaformis (strain CCMP3155) TaxID=1169540 RepID=A0A0G4EZC9_VITBC|nr:unnamed protein product [Vitrella brassicaformis CCMP3155]|eukprot:CEM04142.1 unnamed protein product [Vitrella brassicaformis CCMP3155]